MTDETNSTKELEAGPHAVDFAFFAGKLHVRRAQFIDENAYHPSSNVVLYRWGLWEAVRSLCHEGKPHDFIFCSDLNNIFTAVKECSRCKEKA